MTELLCKACGANPPACANLCLPCWRDKIEADRKKRHAEERARIAARRAGSRAPRWRPELGDRNHGHGTGRQCGE